MNEGFFIVNHQGNIVDINNGALRLLGMIKTNKVIIVLAKNLGLKVIAEGVEKVEQLEFLRDQMCDEIQGYYFHKPMSAIKIEELVARE